MANKQVVDYIQNAEKTNLKKAEIIHNLKDAGWNDADIRDAFAYTGLYSGKLFVAKSDPAIIRPGDLAAVKHWSAWVSITLGYLWLLSGLNKILGEEFVSGFGGYLRSQVLTGSAPNFYKEMLASFALPNARLLAFFIQYSEFAIGACLLIFGLWYFFQKNSIAGFFLCLASIGSLLLILNILLSAGIPWPWIDTSNAFAPGMEVEYLVLFLSFFSIMGYFYEV